MRKAMSENDSRLVGTSDAAALLGVTQRTVMNLIARGVLRPVRLPTLRRTLIDREDLDRLVALGKADSRSSQTHGAPGANRGV